MHTWYQLFKRNGWGEIVSKEAIGRKTLKKIINNEYWKYAENGTSDTV